MRIKELKKQRSALQDTVGRAKELSGHIYPGMSSYYFKVLDSIKELEKYKDTDEEARMMYDKMLAIKKRIHG